MGSTSNGHGLREWRREGRRDGWDLFSGSRIDLALILPVLGESVVPVWVGVKEAGGRLLCKRMKIKGES